ncbi:hypothetical protein D6D08_04761 [Aureobasidium pullulans]|nr:hypothetical protein D6D08_04761 [Aureobasidium pullulans]
MLYGVSGIFFCFFLFISSVIHDLLRILSSAYPVLLKHIVSGNWTNASASAFANFYTEMSPHFSAYEEEETPVPHLISLAKGVVLEIGPGSGTQLPRFNAEAVTRVYGIEPNGTFIPILAAKAAALPELKDKYTIIHAAFENVEILEDYGVVEGSVDTVVCMQVLCSVDNLPTTCKSIHALLKPGGHLLFWEHQNSSDMLTNWMQRIWNLVRRPLMGGCYLDRDIESAISKAGEWEVVEMGRDGVEGYDLMPRTWGCLRKLG